MVPLVSESNGFVGSGVFKKKKKMLMFIMQVRGRLAHWELINFTSWSPFLGWFSSELLL